MVLPHENAPDALRQVTKVLFQNLEKAKNKSFGEGFELRIMRNTAKVRYLVLPFPPHRLTVKEVSALGLNAETAGLLTSSTVMANITSEVLSMINITVSGLMSGGINTAVIINVADSITTNIVLI